MTLWREIEKRHGVLCVADPIVEQMISDKVERISIDKSASGIAPIYKLWLIVMSINYASKFSFCVAQ